MADRIAVVGTGLIGSAMVCAIQNTRPEAEIIWIGGEIGKPRPDAGLDSRVIACAPSSKNLLQELGVWSKLPASRIGPYDRMSVWDYEGTGQVEFSSEDLIEGDATGAQLGYIIENAILLEGIHNRIEESATPVEQYIPGVVEKIQLRESGTVQLCLKNGIELEVDLVCAADGANSPIRNWVNLPAKHWSCQQRAFTAVVTHSQSHRNTAWQAFLPSGPLAFLPLAEVEAKHCSSIVWSLDLDKVEAIEQLSDADFLQHLNRYIPSELGEAVSITPRFGFDLQQTLAKAYYKERVFLVGDSAHNIHPLAGQGANLGFSDISELMRQWHRADQRGEPIWSDSVMRRYQRQRRWQNDSMALAMDVFRHGFGIEEPHFRVLRNKLMHLVQGQDKLKRKISRVATGNASRTSISSR